jgi:hypothetical protein
MQRVQEHLPNGPQFHDSSEIHDGDSVRDRPCKTQIVSDQHDSQAHSLAETEQKTQDFSAHRGIEHRNRLIGNEYVWLQGESCRNNHALTLPSRKLMRVGQEKSLRGPEAGPRESFTHSLSFIPLQPVDPNWFDDCLIYRLPGVQ